MAVFLVTLLAYWPSLSGGFVWDDDAHVTKPELRSWNGLARIWTEPAATQQYYPLLHSAFWIEHRLWGDNPLGYRLLNFFLHAAAACLFAAVLRRLAVPGAWLAAFVFALHPVCVESVAWITEQKNTLSLVFYLAAALGYLRFDVTRGRSAYFSATAFFVAALLCKSVTATLPAALLVVIWWKRGRIEWRRDFLPLLPWLALGLAAGLVTSWVEFHLIGAQGEEYGLSLLQRGLLAGRVVWFYLGKLLWPVSLVFIYPRWNVDPQALASYAFPAGVFLLIAAFAWQGLRSRGPLAALLIFIGTLAPALGFINVYPFKFSFVADHFQYHASLAIIAAVSAGLILGLQRTPRWVAVAAGIVTIGLSGFLTHRQSAVYESNFVLFKTTVEKNPAAWMAHGNLGMMLSEAGRLDEALLHVRKAVELHPNAPEPANSLGHVLNLLGRAPEALSHFQRALALRPNFPEAHNNLGIALIATRRPAEGIAEFNEAIRLDPKYAAPRFNLGLALAQSGRTGEAVGHFEQALRLKPDYAEAELHWGVCLTLQGNHSAAAPHFERAIQLNPTSAETLRLYGVALGQADRIPAAIVQLRRAVQLQPHFAQAHMDLSQLLRLNGQNAEADLHHREALRLSPPR
ncbi:MAG TPA: tetratricopeptide repeat protein [Opitutaceae bacterium]|nr:tetratricopeptide repeat protein [Opitutaceae bacterium]